MHNLMSLTRHVMAVIALAWSLTACAVASETVVLDQGTAPMHPQQPQVAVDGEGMIHIVYGVGDRIRVCRSTNRGESFSPPVELPRVGKLSLGKRRGPRIAAFGQTICVTAVAGEKGGGRDGDLLSFRSTDAGLTWNGPVKVNDVANSAREGLHGMAVSEDGTFHSTWLDLRHGRTEVMSSVSTDQGVTWSKNVLVYASPDGSVCECCHPSVTTHPQKGLIVQWRNSLAGSRDIYLASSQDGGKSFGNAWKLGAGTWMLNACPMDGGAVVVASDGRISSTWRRDQTVYVMVEGMPEERPLGQGAQPWITATGAGVYLAWLDVSESSVCLLSPGQSRPVPLANGGNYPVVGACISGKGVVVVAWERLDNSRQFVECRVVARGQ